MKRLILATTLLVCLTASAAAGEIDGTGKTPPPPPPPCTQNCLSAEDPVKEVSVTDLITVEIIELLIVMLVAR